MSSLSQEFLTQSLKTGFIDSQIASLSAYRPEMVLNCPPNQKVLYSIINELATCTYFQFSVAFITTDGLVQLHQALLDAQERGVKGRILTSDYLNFTDPDAIAAIQNQYPHIELKVYSNEPFHAKGYMFSHENYSTVIVGSSNITANALAKNREWNVKFHSLLQGEFIQKVQEEFLAAWKHAIEVDEAWLTQYRRIHDAISFHRSLRYEQEETQAKEEQRQAVTPNAMQLDALTALSTLRESGAKKGLLISATGTGKTYLSAFDVKAFKAKRFLFIVHRENVARTAMNSFRQVFGPGYRCGLLGAGETTHEDHVFAMIQTLSKDATLAQFDPTAFDYIVIDEVHHAGAASYVKVMNYFKPKFFLGMTATPERTDGVDIYAMFDHNIAYEIRLSQALEADLLCPFHYFGVSDLTIDGQMIEDKSSFNDLIAQERVMRIHETIERYTLDTQLRHGLIFCSRVDEAQQLSARLNMIGYSTIALSGSDSETVRASAIRRLSSKHEDRLDYILTVDIFNEGIDIPCLNQIIMLRPTQSAIVFVQQLGRGLRKYEGKRYVTIIDFIGNYQNNFMVPVALFGNNTYEKDSLRRDVTTGSLGLPGVSTVDFDKIAKERVYDAINTTKFTNRQFLKQEYEKMKYRLGRIPMMMDFTKMDSISPQLFIAANGSYFDFLLSIGELDCSISEGQQQSLRFFSKVLAKGFRPYEYELIDYLLNQPEQKVQVENLVARTLEEVEAYQWDIDSFHASLNVLNGGFFLPASEKKLGAFVYCESYEGGYVASSLFKEFLRNDDYRRFLKDIVDYGRFRFLQRDMKRYRRKDFFLYDKYSRQDVLLLLGFPKELNAQIVGGYFNEKDLKVCPIFVTYDKDVENIDPGINYSDRFISQEQFAWETKHNRNMQSPEVVAMAQQERVNLRIPLFIKKHDDEGTSFYYMGDMKCINLEQTTITTGDDKQEPIVAVRFQMKDRVEDSIYGYIVGS